MTKKLNQNTNNKRIHKYNKIYNKFVVLMLTLITIFFISANNINISTVLSQESQNGTTSVRNCSCRFTYQGRTYVGPAGVTNECETQPTPTTTSNFPSCDAWRNEYINANLRDIGNNITIPTSENNNNILQQFGTACTKSYGNCQNGYRNLQQMLDGNTLPPIFFSHGGNGNTQENITTNRIIDSITAFIRTRSNNPNISTLQLCLKEDISSILVLRNSITTNGGDNTFVLDNIISDGDQGRSTVNSELIPVDSSTNGILMCKNQTTPQRNSSGETYGCCRNGFYAPKGTTFDQTNIPSSICCPKIKVNNENNFLFADFSYVDQSSWASFGGGTIAIGQCQYAYAGQPINQIHINNINNDPVIQGNIYISNNQLTIDDINQNQMTDVPTNTPLENLKNIYTYEYDDENDPITLQLILVSDNDERLVANNIVKFPAYDNNTPTPTEIEINNQNLQSPLSYCDPQNQNINCIVYRERNYIKIEQPEIHFRSSGNYGQDNCLRCMKNGEVVGIDSTDNKLLVCQDGRYREENLINNSLSDTLAYLRARESLAGDNSDLFQRCRSQGGIFIFLGCIDTTPIGVITGLIRIALGIFGGLALLQMIQIGVIYQLGESQGNKQRLENARKRLISIFTGILILVFSTLIFRIIGVNILDILPSGSI